MNSMLYIGFVKPLEYRTYKIQSRFKNFGNRYELKKKWIVRKIELDK